MAKETASIYIKLQSGDLEKNIGNVAKAFRQARREAANAKVGSKEYIEATRRVRELKGQLDAHNRLLGRTGGAWSNLKTIMLGVFGGNLITGGIRAIGSALRGALDTVKAYQDANAGLNAVLGTTSEATKNLRDQQLELGASTAFTAGQVANAQTELARLGFSLTEITNMTPAVLSLASAAGTDLATAAEIAGATMRGFGLDSSETNRVVDVMAKSFQSSALDIGKFQVAMRQVAPVAKNAGLSIEQTTALIGVLADRGVRAESAGTGLRNILGRLAQSGMSWNEAMNEINSSTDSTKTAIELFGLEASTMAIILAQNADAAGVLEGKLNDAGGAAEAMAKEQLNTLTGDLTILQSAWEGLILSVENGEGVFSNALRSAAQSLTALIGDIQSTNKVSQQLQETLGLSYWKDGLLSPGLYNNLAEFQESLNGIETTTKEYAADNAWSKIQGNIQMLQDMASVIDGTTEEGAAKIKLIEQQVKNLERIRAHAALATLPGRAATVTTTTTTTTTTTGTTTAQTPEELRAAKAKEAMAVLKQSYEEEKLYLAQQRMDGLISEETYQQELQALKISSLLLEREALMAQGMDITAVEQQIADERISILNELDKARQDSQDKQDAMAEQEKARNKQLADAEEARQMAAIQSAVATGAAAADGADSIEDGAKRSLNAIRGMIKGYLAEAIAASIAQGAKTAPPPLGLILGAAAGAAASLLFDQIIPAFAKGTPSAPGGMALVGEEGPELVNIPRGSQVFTATETARMMGQGGPFGQTFTGSTTPAPVPGASTSTQGSSADMRAFIDEIRSWSREQRVVFEKRSFDDFNRQLSDTESLVKFKKS